MFLIREQKVGRKILLTPIKEVVMTEIMFPQVLNVRDVGRRDTETRVYVGRPTKWSNPYQIGKDGTREEVIALYKRYFFGSGTAMAAAQELRGKDLVCWCAPLPCHADILLEFANRD